VFGNLKQLATIGLIWECSCACGSKCFSLKKYIKMMFFYFKKIILRAVHQNDPKTLKKKLF
jgi:hypothetical protein